MTNHADSHSPLGGLVGTSPPMLALAEQIRLVAADRSGTVLLLGESGTGKELVARAIHNSGPRQAAHFVAVNCAAIPDDLLESELFGYARGAFTGANASRTGRIKHADGGTLFLDEIGDMRPHLQAKILRVLQEQEVTALGHNEPTSVDVRVIAATHRHLEEAVERGEFREDLYYRLAVIPLRLPPLRERIEDVPALATHFAERFAAERARALGGLSPELLERLVRHDWPGNVRELENLMLRLVILHQGEGPLTLSELPADFGRRRQGPAAERSSGLIAPEERALLSALLDADMDEGRALESLRGRLVELNGRLQGGRG